MKTFTLSRVLPLVATSFTLGVPLATAASNLSVDESLGNSPYTQSVGADFNSITVGTTSVGVFDQNDGVGVDVQGPLILGEQANSNGTFNVGSGNAASTDGSLLEAASLVVGNKGTGLFEVNAYATVEISGTITLGASSTSANELNLGYGELIAGQIGQTTGTPAGAFVFSGGVLTPVGNNSTFMQGLAVAGISVTATINTNGFNITISQTLSHYAVGNSDGGLTKTGKGTLTLTGTNSYNGPTTLNAGVLNAGNAGALGSVGSIVFGGGTLQYSAASSGTDFSSRFSTAANQPISLDTNGQNVTLGSGFGSAGTSLTKLGAGTLTLSGNNTYTGGTVLSGGVLNAGSAMALGSGTITFAGGTLQYSAASASTDFSAQFSTAAGQAVSLDTGGQNVTIGYGFGGSGTSLTKLGAGTLTINGGNTYTGATNLNTGTVSVDNPGALGSGGTIVFNGGTLQYGDASHPDAAYNAADYSARFSTAANQAYRINTNGHSIVYGTALTSAGGTLTKLGAGTLTLSGNNTYSGTTNIDAGTLLLNGSNTGGKSLIVNAGATLGGTGSTTLPVNVAGSGTVNPGDNGGAAGSAANVGELRVGGLNLGNFGTMALDVNSPTLYDVLESSGPVELSGGKLSLSLAAGLVFIPGQTLDLIHLTGGSLSGTFAGIANGRIYSFDGQSFEAMYSPSDFELVAVAVPEPSTGRLVGALLVAGGLGLARGRGTRLADRRAVA